MIMKILRQLSSEYIKSKKGFTIVELMVGFALIAIVASVTLKLFTSFSETSQAVQKREKVSIKSKAAFDFISDVVSKSGSIENYQNNFVACGGVTGFATPCNSNQFAVVVSDIYGVVVGGTPVIVVSSNVSNSNYCPEIEGKAYFYGSSGYLGSADVSNATMDTTINPAGCNLNISPSFTLSLGDKVAVGTRLVRFVYDSGDKNLNAEIFTFDSSNPNTTPTDCELPNCTSFTLIENIEGFTATYSISSGGTIDDTKTSYTEDDLNSGSILGAKLVFDVKKSETADKPIRKVLYVSRRAGL
jgi:prepilin-type N-terminal cleavage/methylation domain-containing protein